MKKALLFLPLIGVFLFVINGNASAQAKKDAKKPAAEELTIQTSMQCKMCRDKLSEVLKKDKGIQKSKIDLKTKTITLKYDPKTTNPDKIRKAISKIGYDADDVPADPKAYAKLKPCCKKKE